MKLLFTVFLSCLWYSCFSQDYAYQDSISGHQTAVTFNSINDGHPGPPKKPFFQATIGHVFDDSSVANICASNTFASDGFFRNSLFSVNVGNAIFRNKQFDLLPSVGGSWQHTWSYERDKKPTVATLLAVQYPFNDEDGSTEFQTTLIVNKNVGQVGVSYFNAFLNFPVNGSPSFTALVGYKIFISETNNLFFDVLYDPSDSVTFEAALEINLPKGNVISPGINYQRDTVGNSNIYGVGVAILYQTL